jgi:glucose-1-phosphate thymidylyltransferase
MAGSPVRWVVRDFLKDVAPLAFDGDEVADAAGPKGWVLVNARLTPTAKALEIIRELAESADAQVFLDDGILAMATVPRGVPALQLEDTSLWRSWSAKVPGVRIDTATAKGWLLRYPHEVVLRGPKLVSEQIELWKTSGEFAAAGDNVYLHRDATVKQPVVLDGSLGPILVEQGAVIEPFSIIRGPVWIGPQAIVNPHSLIKNGCALGRSARAGGELEATTMASYSNKQHFGFVGHSYLGSWVNLGAGTTCSNLKNSYGEIRVDYGEGPVDVGGTFLGMVMGDYSKASIQTSILTAKLIGTASMLYGTIANHVPDFVNHARSLGAETQVDLETVIRMQTRMFARRGLAPTEGQREVLRRVHAHTLPLREHLPQTPLRF